LPDFEEKAQSHFMSLLDSAEKYGRKEAEGKNLGFDIVLGEKMTINGVPFEEITKKRQEM
jgi:hypothetical protein